MKSAVPPSVHRLRRELARRVDDWRDERRNRAAVPGRRNRVAFVIRSSGPSGVPRTVFAVANALSDLGHDVEIVVMVRGREEPSFPLRPEIRLTWLDDRYDTEADRRIGPARRNPAMPEHLRRMDRSPSSLTPEGINTSLTAYGDYLLQQHFEKQLPQIVVTTRPEFAVAAVRWSTPHSIVVHQEHLSFTTRGRGLREAIKGIAHTPSQERRLDAFLTLTDADLEDWTAYLDRPDIHTGVIPNSSPFAVGAPAPLERQVIIAAGRLVDQKGYDLLIDAYAPLAEEFPSWEVHIYGAGTKHGELVRQIEDRGLGDKVRLMGVTDQFEDVLASASIYVMSSRFEGLPMVLLEALSKGIPPVSFDCPQGPRQLIRDGENGLLVPAEDIEGMTNALRELMSDPSLRRRLGDAALASAHTYSLDSVMERWTQLFDTLESRRSARG